MNWVHILISVAMALQTIEMLMIQRMAWARDPWSSQNQSWRQQILVLMLLLRLMAALVGIIMPSASSAGVMLVSSFWLVYHYGGLFNGSSDVMAIQVLGACLVASIWPQFEKASLIFVAVQSLMSYFVAGLSKAWRKEWFTGKTLDQILRYSNACQTSQLRTFLLNRPVLILSASIAVIAFECLFPMVLLKPDLVGMFLALGVIFHLGNFMIFGLNRFFFVWMATYPAILLVF